MEKNIIDKEIIELKANISHYPILSHINQKKKYAQKYDIQYRSFNNKDTTWEYLGKETVIKHVWKRIK